MPSKLVEAIEMFEDFAEWRGMEYIQPRLIVASPELAMLLPEPLAREYNALPQLTAGRVLTILISDPTDFLAMDAIRFVLGSNTEFRFAFSSRRAIQEAIDRMYGTPPIAGTLGVWDA
jgi:hypothetical protein